HTAASCYASCDRSPLTGVLYLFADDYNSFPFFGSVLSHLEPRRRETPIHVALPHVMYNVVMLPGQNAGFLGAAHNPFQVTRDPNGEAFRLDELELPDNLPLARLEDRRSLLSIVDGQLRRGDWRAHRQTTT